MKAFVIGLLMSVLLCACVSLPQEIMFVPDGEFDLSATAAPDARAFQIVFVSKSNEAICLDADQWPNHLGQVHMGSTRAQVVANGRIYPAIDQNFGYCVGPRCVIRIEPRQRIEGSVAFSEFSGWNQVPEGAQLRYVVRPWFCAQRPGHNGLR